MPFAKQSIQSPFAKHRNHIGALFCANNEKVVG
jgi:hypothetical protein